MTQRAEQPAVPAQDTCLICGAERGVNRTHSDFEIDMPHPFISSVRHAPPAVQPSREQFEKWAQSEPHLHIDLATDDEGREYILTRTIACEAAFMAGASCQVPQSSREPDGYAYRYHDCIRFNNGQMVNGAEPIEAIPLLFGEPQEVHGRITCASSPELGAATPTIEEK